MTSLGRLCLSLGGALDSVIKVFDSEYSDDEPQKDRKRSYSVIELDSEKLDQSVKKLDQAEEYKRKAEELEWEAAELERQAEAHLQSLR